MNTCKLLQISSGLTHIISVCVCVCVQVYHLASVRLRDLCLKLDVATELRGKIWTCFEHTVVHCTELMKERHLDQLLLCCVYIISRVSRRGEELVLVSQSASYTDSVLVGPVRSLYVI